MLQAVTQDFSRPVVPVFPSHQTWIDRGLIYPLMLPPVNIPLDQSPSDSPEYLISPASAGTTMSSSPSPCRDLSSAKPQQQFDFVNLTGNLQTDEAIVKEHKLHAPVPRLATDVRDINSLDASTTSPPNHSPKLTEGLRKTRRSQSYPQIHIGAEVTPSSSMCLSAPPIKGRIRKKPSQPRLSQRKPPLACLFCRGRKIACGAPPVGSEKLSCE